MRGFYFLLALAFVVGMTFAAWHSYDGTHMDTLDRAWLTLKWFVAFCAFAGFTAVVCAFFEKRRNGY